MKNLVTTLILSLVIVSTASAQITKDQALKGKVEDGKIEFKSVGISITVDSAEEIDSTFKMEDLTSLIEQSGENESLSFKITCNGKPMSNGVKSHMSYKVNGNSDESEKFVKNVEKIITSAKSYYTKR